jgi:hypothetical protein
MAAVLYTFHHEQVRTPERRSVMKRLVMLRYGGLKMSRLARPLLGILIAATLVIFAATPALAYGQENWQIALAGTAVAPGTGQGFGFWGWCALGGGVTSGNNGDCEVAQYVHAPSGSGFTCHESLNITSWDVESNGDFFITGTATVNPTSLTGPCVGIFPGSASFTGVDSLIPAAPGHYNLTSIFLGPGLRGEFQIQVTQIP